MQELHCFSSVIAYDYFPEWVEPCNQVADRVLKETDNKNVIVNHGYNIHMEPEVKNIANEIGVLTRKFLTDQGYDLTKYSLIFESFWPQEFSKNGWSYHDIHVHPNTYVSGFLFLKCGENTSYPMFHDPRPGKNMLQLPELDKEKITLASASVHLKPKPGILMMFNSFLPHSYGLHDGVEDFRFIHYTIQVIPTLYIKENHV